MRTKTLALSALLGMVGAGTAMSQSVVYSLNAVGYITLTLQPGYNIIACQLITTNNTIGSLINNAGGPYDGSTVFKYNAATGHYTEDFADSQGSSYSNGWDFNGTLTLNPGEAVWFNNGTPNPVTMTFVGTVPQGTNTVNIQGGYQMISSPVPFGGDLVTNMGFTNYSDESTVFVFNNPAPGKPRGGYAEYFVDLSGGSSGYMSQWDTPDPTLQVGQGFFYNSGTGGNAYGSAGPTPWVQVFSVNP